MTTTTKTETTYTTDGSVRGSCGHRHRSIATAVECLYRDQRGCASQGGYSDRSVYAIDADEQRPLNDDETLELHDIDDLL